MIDMYILVNGEPQRYNGEILKRLVGSKVVKVISNPTEDDLREFGYMELVPAETPEYNWETQELKTSYEIVDGKIYERIEVVDKTETVTDEVGTV